MTKKEIDERVKELEEQFVATAIKALEASKPKVKPVAKPIAAKIAPITP